MIKSFKIFENKNEINFIPFELREEYVDGFEWNEENEKKAYEIMDKPKLLQNYKLMCNEKYLEEIEKLVLNKNIQFYNFNYGNGEIRKKHLLVKEISINLRNVLVFNGNNKVEKYAVDERKPITNYIPKLNPDVDPYGEEDWTD